jgi:lysophospholipase L1-like esterase
MKKSVLVVVAVVATLVAAPLSRADTGVEYYLSLGDSLAQGSQPIGGQPFGSAGYNQGYADQLLKLVREPNAQLRLVKLGCGGESTTTMIVGSPWCDFRAGSQLAEAEAFLRAHRGDVAFVTIDIGAHDVLDAGGGVAAIQTNLPVILDELRAAAGPGVPIVGMTYYSPTLSFLWSETHDVQAVAARAAQLVAFNDLLEAIYADAGDSVADVEGAFLSTDTTLVDGVPLDVARLCEWTWMCAIPPLGPSLDANSTGYAVIAHAFAEALPS